MRILFSIVANAILCTACVAQKAEEVTIKTPTGFSTINVVKDFGRVRHIAVNTNGDLYLKLERLEKGKGIIRLRDTNKDGIYDDTLA
ncbi:hypothetical protein, partial [Enterococcus faecium]